MAIKILNEDTIRNNWREVLQLIKTLPEMLPEDVSDGERERVSRNAELLFNLHIKFSSRLAIMPASSKPIYHNACVGGYVDHVIRVYKFCSRLYDSWNSDFNMNTEGFEKHELLFVALVHDLGKMGLPQKGMEFYQKNDSDWHVRKQLKFYKTNENLPFLTTEDMTLYILQSIGVVCTLNEWHAIRVHDGPYIVENDPYYKNPFKSGKFRTNLPIIMHHADYMAMRFEYDRWTSTLEKKTETTA